MDEFGLLQEGYCKEVYYYPVVDGFTVDWLKALDGMLILGQPQDKDSIGLHKSELKIMYPRSLVNNSRSLQTVNVIVDLTESSSYDLSPLTDIVLDSITFEVYIKLAETFTTVEQKSEV